jgi:hypothetical protein
MTKPLPLRTPSDLAFDAPRRALRTSLGPLRFQAGNRDGDETPVTIVARTGQVIDHWFWGRMVHDFAGMTVHKQRLPIDWCHLDDEILGRIDEWQAGADLTVKGALVHFRADDRASEVAHKAGHGVPYEASIDWRPAKPGDVLIEFVPEGVTVLVNEQQIEGPLTVFRRWPLRAVAICPHGADSDTATDLARAGPAELVPLSVHLLSREAPMPRYAAKKTKPVDPPAEDPLEETPPAPPAEDETPPAETPAGAPETDPDTPPEAEPPPKPAGDQQLSAKQLQAWRAEFGADNALTWLTEGIDLAEARRRHNEQLAAQLKAAQAERDKLQQRITQAGAGAGLGERDPLTAGDEDPPPAGRNGSPTPSARERAAAGIKARMTAAAARN